MKYKIVRIIGAIASFRHLRKLYRSSSRIQPVCLIGTISAKPGLIATIMSPLVTSQLKGAIIIIWTSLALPLTRFVRKTNLS